jgi:hypothetical protein
MDTAKQDRTRAKAQFTRAKKALADAVNHVDPSLDTIERRLTELKKRWDNVQDTHDAYAEHESEMTTDEASKLSEWIDSIAEEFNDMEMKSDKRKDKIRGNQSPTGDNKTISSGNSVGAVKVERMKFSQFDGDIRRYPQFKEEFCKHVATLYREDQRAFVLKGYLTKHVLEEVESCGEDYDAMWERLDLRFGDSGRLINIIMDEITSLPNPQNDDYATIKMIRTVEKAYRDLCRLGTEHEMYNASTIVAIEKVMPERMREEWALQVAGKAMPSKKKFLTLLECLQLWLNRLEYLSDDVRAIPRTTGMSAHVDRGNRTPHPSYTQENCWIHDYEEGSHPIWRCKAFYNQSVEERLRLVEKHKACKVCLLKSCTSKTSPVECRRGFGFRCRVKGCEEIHNRMLHDFPKKSVSSPCSSCSHANTDASASASTLLQIQNL